MNPALYADYSQARPDPAAVKAAGYAGIIRYLAPEPNPKVIATAEYEAALAQGLDVLLVFESSANRALMGAAAGASDASTAESQARALGYPSDASHPIFYACDFAPSGAQMPTVLAYFAGVASNPRKHGWGPYGGLSVVVAVNAAVQADAYWQTVAWSSGQISPIANLYQRLQPTLSIPGYSGEYDEDVLLKPFVPAPAPIATEEEMPLLVTDPTGAVWAVALDLSSKVHVANPTDLSALIDSGLYKTGVVLSAAQLTGIPTVG